MLRRVILLAVVGTALGAGVAYSGTGMRDVYTDGAGTMAPRDPYTNGGKATKFDVYSDGARVTGSRDVFTDGAKVTDRRDLFSDGARITNRDGYTDDSRF